MSSNDGEVCRERQRDDASSEDLLPSLKRPKSELVVHAPNAVRDVENNGRVPVEASERNSTWDNRERMRKLASQSDSLSDRVANFNARSADGVDDDDTWDDDSSVEFLFVRAPDFEASVDHDSDTVTCNAAAPIHDTFASLQPTTPTRLSSDGAAMWEIKSELRSCEESEVPGSLDSAVEPVNDCASSTSPEEVLLIANEAALPNRPAPFNNLTSAYVQSLAETSYVMLHDARWKTVASTSDGSDSSGNTARPLFRWEHGDDLAALVWFARRYIATPEEAKEYDKSSPRTTCPCLLCRRNNEAIAPEGRSNDLMTLGAVEWEQVGHLPAKVVEEATDRSLHLYARLFYRKGPWFRVDDVFWKYYAKTRHKASPQQVLVNGDASYSTHIRLEQHLRNLQNLLEDIQCLHRKGLMREFQDEAECGRIADSNLFSKDERTAILAKLGVKKATGKPNEIWTQMRTQRPIFGGIKKPHCPSSDHRILLPIRKHADAVIQHRFFRALLQSCSTNYRSESELRNHISHLQSRLGQFSSCFRLREAPTLTLQRCVRLFVCASSGPGEMRGLASGWASLRPTRAGDSMPPLARLFPPPNSSSFSHVSHPGLACRFGLKPCWFRESYQLQVNSNGEHAFLTRESFTAWELAVELRAQVDYLLQLHETLRYNERRVKRGLAPLGGTFNSNSSIDFLGLLQARRRKVVKGLLPLSSQEQCYELLQMIDAMLAQCWAACEDPLPESEQVLIAIGVISVHVLMYRLRTVDPKESTALASRPWLRHLTWESVLAYVLWDVIPLFERLEMYHAATLALETLLFGSPLERLSVTTDLFVTVFPSDLPHFPLANTLLTRRSRGKGLDRLIIDHNHILSQDMKRSAVAKEHFKTRRDEILRFCEIVVTTTLDSSLVTFSSLRSLARRLKQPLSFTIGARSCVEASFLGLRYETQQSESESDRVLNPKTKRYTDWTPTIDTAVANSLTNHCGDLTESIVGRRCAFVGFEDDGIDTSSLNVEQLAMEFYRTGRFPLTPGENGVASYGWVGWHDEGTHVRALFRILCAPLLGMDWFKGCSQLTSDCKQSPLLFLTPYQQSPCDLHVGFSRYLANNENLSLPSSCAGIYNRRREAIDSFLKELSNLNAQELCDCVYSSMETRRAHHSQLSRKDPFLERDCQRLRTLSLIAAACGGSLLSRIFRCFLYDYRHYSGGLPDLLLVRGVYLDTNENAASLPTTAETREIKTDTFVQVDGVEDTADTSLSLLVDLEEWIGEGTFVKEAVGGSSILLDDEFLGCSKVSDALSASNRSGFRGRGSASAPSEIVNGTDSNIPAGSSHAARTTTPMLPPKLLLSYNSRPVRAECLMVEVKSSNDRLDGRQEDWLNILDNDSEHETCSWSRARVCKFLKSAESTSEPATRPRYRTRPDQKAQ